MDESLHPFRSHTTRTLDKSTRSLGNRVRSILADAEFVELVAEVYNKPVVPNLRGGLWYVRPELRAANAYFKSTDGHTNQCAFSLKRLNLHLINLIEENHGVLLVDSTRRGKKVPDSFAKTVPIWCAVLNYANFGKLELFCPRGLVSASEISLIESEIPMWTQKFISLVGIENVPRLSKPLRPLYVFQDSLLPESVESSIFEGYNAVVLVTASKQAQDGVDREMGYTYVQGAGDDHELWAPKQFSADVLWSLGVNNSTSESECLAMIERALSEEKEVVVPETRVTKSIYIQTHCAPTSTDVVIDLINGWPLASGKKGARELAQKLPEICAYFESQNKPVARILSNSELGVCVALALDCRYFDAAGLKCLKQTYVSKETMQQRAVQIYANAGVSPSRIAVNVVGNYLRS